ncbi:hypothetical protein [Bradyrhizobium sp. BWC-3-1]|uniref:hypothetical protein n=1 Tax=Bradyrhizobium sp. BWC-3-1 TaxID=3080012 RepID=UPI00293F1902|nr:hypothetical protein [Bradyrhizobium sp. BWC-3-1]WOH57497.1 hypothetical protein RX329_35600 [Bradyrhizobium sp. BWC-3-1]
MKTPRKADLKWRGIAPGMTSKLSEMFERRMLRQGRTVKDLTDITQQGEHQQKA